jgi:small-conductance mechanosensitive channel
MKPGTGFRNLIAAFFAELEKTAVLWQLGIIAASLVLAWLLTRYISVKLTTTKTSASAARFGVGGAHRLLLPVCALLCVLVARFVLPHLNMSIALLNLAIPLLASLVLIRALVYLLRTAFDASQWLALSERAIAWTVWIGVALYITGVLPEITGALDRVGFKMSGKRISLLTILQAPIVVAAAAVLGMWIGRLIERRLMSAGTFDLNVRVVISRLVRVALMVVAVLIALPALGIDVTVLSVFGGALGVGIGFGLQKIASNYVSGFTILLDRSISPGALVTIDKYYGQVTHVGSRYVVVRGLDGTEAIVPNETLVTSVVINHSYSDRKVRVDLAVQVSYRSDVEHVLSLLLAIAKANPRVLSEPEPIALLSKFGESGIDIELYVWISDPESGKANVQSDINREIWKVFQREGIEIPYPQREIRLLQNARPPGGPPGGLPSVSSIRTVT